MVSDRHVGVDVAPALERVLHVAQGGVASLHLADVVVVGLVDQGGELVERRLRVLRVEQERQPLGVGLDGLAARAPHQVGHGLDPEGVGRLGPREVDAELAVAGLVVGLLQALLDRVHDRIGLALRRAGARQRGYDHKLFAGAARRGSGCGLGFSRGSCRGSARRRRGSRRTAAGAAGATCCHKASQDGDEQD